MKNSHTFVSCISKLLITCTLMLGGCTSSGKYHLDLFYASTCPRCKDFIENVIPYLEETYGNDLVITQHDIDEDESLDLYAKTISLLEDYEVDDDTGSVPFIVFDGSFVKIGYKSSEKELLLENIDKAMNGEAIDISKDYYLFQSGESLY